MTTQEIDKIPETKTKTKSKYLSYLFLLIQILKRKDKTQIFGLGPGF